MTPLFVLVSVALLRALAVMSFCIVLGALVCISPTLDDRGFHYSASDRTALQDAVFWMVVALYLWQTAAAL